MFKNLILKISILIPLVVNAQEFTGSGKDISGILGSIKTFSQAYMESDYETMVDLYTQDAKILPPGTPIISGKEDIKKRWILPKGVKVVYHHIIPSEITVIEDTAYDHGIYEGASSDKDGNHTEWRGKYVIVWKKVDNHWKIYLDIWNRILESD